MRLSPHRTLPLAAVLLGFTACQTSETPSTSSQVSRAATAETTLEEDFSYPGAEAHLPSGITLKKGDGNLLIVDCATQAHVVKLESFLHGDRNFCFDIRGQNAYLTLELDGVYLISTSNAAVQATVLVGTQQSVVDLVEGPNSVGFDASGNALGARVLELRLSI
jgi:hypothetical protein